MIITRLLGGLGNQMFQYAAGLALAERHRTVLKLDASWFRVRPEYEAHNRYALSCFNITEQFATAEEIDRVRGFPLTRTERWSVALARLLRLRRYTERMQPAAPNRCAQDVSFQPAFFTQPDSTYLEGMWQSERYFSEIAPLLHLHFTFRYPPQPAVAALAERIRSGSSAAVHFRRGDYVTNTAFNREIGVVGLDYYRRAVGELRARHPDTTLYIFSDDIDTIEREFRPPGPHVFARFTQPWNAYDTIRLMSLCEHAIISNSTFAWWAAWLNSKPGKTVIAPATWLASRPAAAEDILPASWLRL
jgi:hypothetical protein